MTGALAIFKNGNMCHRTILAKKTASSISPWLTMDALEPFRVLDQNKIESTSLQKENIPLISTCCVQQKMRNQLLLVIRTLSTCTGR
jgi:hypothetical protein